MGFSSPVALVMVGWTSGFTVVMVVAHYGGAVPLWWCFTMVVFHYGGVPLW